MKHLRLFKLRMNQFFVVGNPIAHSKSPIIHQHFAEQTGIIQNYDQLLLDTDKFEVELLKLVEAGVAGVNVTLPFKERAFALCSEVTERAELSKAVNTLAFRERKIVGDNTDGAGLVADLLFHRIIIAGANILIIGAGGATRGVIPSLLAAQPKSLSITNRTQEKANKIVDEISDKRLSAVDIEEVGDQYDIIINASSSSVTQQLPKIASIIFNNAKCVYDMFYQAQPTVFMQWAKEHNRDASTIDGLGMLIEQAAEAFFVWNNVRPDTTTIRATLRNLI